MHRKITALTTGGSNCFFLMPRSAAPSAVSHYDLQLMRLQSGFGKQTAACFYHHVDVYMCMCFTDPLYTCCWPLESPSSVVSFKMVATSLSIVTWAIPAPISPAPRTASFLKKKAKSTISWYIQFLMTALPTILTSLLSPAAQSGSFCRPPDHRKGQSELWTLMSSPACQSSRKQTRGHASW